MSEAVMSPAGSAGASPESAAATSRGNVWLSLEPAASVAVTVTW